MNRTVIEQLVQELQFSEELDHILPKSHFGSLERNVVLACKACNGVKRADSVLEPWETAQQALDEKREQLIDRARILIAQRMATYDDEWRKATSIMHELWWGRA